MAISMKGTSVYMHVGLLEEMNPWSIVPVMMCMSGVQWERIVLWVSESETESGFVGRSSLLLSLFKQGLRPRTAH